MENESLLIEKAALGDEESFSILINNYKNYVFAIILNFIKNYDEAENVAQDVFFQIFVSLPKYDQNNFKAWLGRITTNKSIDCLRKKKAKFNEEALGEDNNSVDAAANPEIILLEKYNREKLKKALDGIPDIYRVTLEKFYFREKSYEAIAEEEDVTIKTVASRLYRAKILLREKWRCEDESL